MKKYSHVFSVFSLVALVFLFLPLIQSAVQPKSFGQFGRYRGDHLLEASSKTPRHKGDEYCLDCHEEEWEMADAKHGVIPCENCHFLPKPHAAPSNSGKEKEGLFKYTKTEKMPIDSTAGPCINCHIYLPARPKGFPQVKDVEKHIKDGWKKNMGDVDVKTPCSRCHNSHYPKAFAKVNI